MDEINGIMINDLPDANIISNDNITSYLNNLDAIYWADPK